MIKTLPAGLISIAAAWVLKVALCSYNAHGLPYGTQCTLMLVSVCTVPSIELEWTLFYTGVRTEATSPSVPVHLSSPLPKCLGPGPTGRVSDHLPQPDIHPETACVLGIPLHTLPRPVQFVICLVGVLIFYLPYGYTQEWIFRLPGFRPFGWYLTLIQFAFYSVFGFLELKIKGEKERRIPMRHYLLLAFLTVATMGLSNTSLGYLNFPTQVIFKSCILIPVMIGGILIQGKKYGVLDGITLALMSIGLILFTLADSTVQPNFNTTGVVLISLALCADAIIGNVQEKTLKEFSSSNVEMVTYSYAVGFIYILLGMFATVSLTPGFWFCWKVFLFRMQSATGCNSQGLYQISLACLPLPLRDTHPQVYLMAALFSMTGYLGINFVLVLVRSFGALMAATVTTFRKALTIVFSFLLFTKPFTSQYVWSGLLVLLGIFLSMYIKNRLKVNTVILEQLSKMTEHCQWYRRWLRSYFCRHSMMTQP